MHRQSVTHQKLIEFRVFVFTLQQDIFKNVAKRKDTDQPIVFVDHYKSVDTRLSDCIKDGIEAVLHRTGVYAREVLKAMLISRLGSGWTLTHV